MLDSVRTLLASALGIAHARLELVGAELQQELSRLVALLVGSLAALFFAGLGVAFVAALAWRVQSRLGAGELVPVARTFERGIALGQWVAGALMVIQLVRRVFRRR